MNEKAGSDFHDRNDDKARVRDGPEDAHADGVVVLEESNEPPTGDSLPLCRWGNWASYDIRFVAGRHRRRDSEEDVARRGWQQGGNKIGRAHV